MKRVVWQFSERQIHLQKRHVFGESYLHTTFKILCMPTPLFYTLSSILSTSWLKWSLFSQKFFNTRAYENLISCHTPNPTIINFPVISLLLPMSSTIIKIGSLRLDLTNLMIKHVKAIIKVLLCRKAKHCLVGFPEKLIVITTWEAIMWLILLPPVDSDYLNIWSQEALFKFSIIVISLYIWCL